MQETLTSPLCFLHHLIQSVCFFMKAVFIHNFKNSRLWSPPRLHCPFLCCESLFLPPYAWLFEILPLAYFRKNSGFFALFLKPPQCIFKGFRLMDCYFRHRSPPSQTYLGRGRGIVEFLHEQPCPAYMTVVLRSPPFFTSCRAAKSRQQVI